MEDCRHCLIRNALEGMASGLVVTDQEGRILLANRGSQELLGLQGPFLGQPLAPYLREPVLQTFWQMVRQEGRRAIGTFSLKSPRSVDVKLVVNPCLSPQGRLIGWVMLFCDVTEERRVTLELNAQLAARLLGLMELGPFRESDGSASLTPQELRILSLVGQGLSNEEIARHLYIEVDTVRTHLKSLYRKLGLRSRYEAIVYALRHGLDAAFNPPGLS